GVVGVVQCHEARIRRAGIRGCRVEARPAGAAAPICFAEPVMRGLTFDIAHLLAGTLVLVSFLELYQDRLYALLNKFALHALVLAGFDRDGLALDMAGTLEPLAASAHTVQSAVRRTRVDDADHRRRRLLRTRWQRPYRCRAAEQRHEVAPPYAGHRASSRLGAAGSPHTQPAAERPRTPWARP